MASKRTIGVAAALVVIESIQIAVVIFDGACGTLRTRQWLIILIFRKERRIVHIWTGMVRMAEMKPGLVRFEPARRFGVQP